MPLATPTSFTFAADSSAIEIDASWGAVSGADHYELEVEESVASVWTVFDTFTVAGTSTTLDESDGIEAGGSYRGRVRAVPPA